MDELLTDDEHEAMRLSAALANLLHRICGATPDWTEAAYRIHGIQHMVMAQAAARAYPDLYRRLGSTIDTPEEPPKIIYLVTPCESHEDQLAGACLTCGWSLGTRDEAGEDQRVVGWRIDPFGEAPHPLGPDCDQGTDPCVPLYRRGDGS